MIARLSACTEMNMPSNSTASKSFCDLSLNWTDGIARRAASAPQAQPQTSGTERARLGARATTLGGTRLALRHTPRWRPGLFRLALKTAGHSEAALRARARRVAGGVASPGAASTGSRAMIHFVMLIRCVLYLSSDPRTPRVASVACSSRVLARRRPAVVLCARPATRAAGRARCG